MEKNELLSRTDVLYGSALLSTKETYSTNFDALDRVLPNGGWPCVGITEILVPDIATSALRILVPALADVSKGKKWIVLVNPPYTLFPLAWEQEGADIAKILVVDLPESDSSIRKNTLWAYEQALRFDDCGAALFWANEMSNLELRKLHLAAEAGNTWAIIFRSLRFASHSSSASLRIQLETIPLSTLPSASQDTSVIKFKGVVLKGSGYSRGREFFLEI